MHFWSLVLIIVNCDDLEFKDMYSCSDNFCDYTFSICSVNVLILSSACTTLTIRQLFPHFPGKLLPWRKRDFGSNIRKSTQSFRKKSLFVVVQSLSHVLLFATPWTAACQPSLFFTISQNLLKLICFELVMPSNHLVLSSPSPPTFTLSWRQDLFQ